MKNIERFKEAVEVWRSVANKHRKCGAADTEPRQILREIISRKMNTGESGLPLTAERWELYTSSWPCDNAATALNEAAEVIMKVVDDFAPWETLSIEKQDHFFI